MSDKSGEFYDGITKLLDKERAIDYLDLGYIGSHVP